MNYAQQSDQALLPKYDKPLLAIAAGAVSGLAKALVTAIAKLMGLTSFDLLQLSASILLKKEIHTLSEYLLGWTVVLVFGGIVGLFFYYSLALLGRDYLIFKAIGAGLLFWLANSTIAIYLGAPLIRFQKLSIHLSLFFSGIIYGIVLSWLMRSWVFKEQKSSLN
jgi:hypothetical protein